MIKALKGISIYVMLPLVAALAAVPSKIVYQGRLSKSGVGAAGQHTITVQFIDASGTNLPYSQTFDVNVPTSGDFSLEINNIPPDADWVNGLPKMRVIVGGETLTPDQSFSASPYALVARTVENLDTDKVKLAPAGSAFGSGLLSSWQSPTNPAGINADVIVGTVTAASSHASRHLLNGPDPIPAGGLSPSQIQGTSLILTSSITQTIQPTQPVVPLIVKGQPNTGPSLNMFEVWDNAAVPSKRFHIQGSGTAYFNGNVGIGTANPGDALDVLGNIQLSGGNKKILFSDPGNFDFSIVHQGGNSLNIVSPETSRTIASFHNNGNVGIGTTTPGESLEVHGNVKLDNESINGIRALTPTNWGHSVGYPVVLLGPTTGTGNVAIGYDPSGNPYSGFTGDGREVLFRNGAQFVTPNSANTSFNLYQIVLKDGKVGINTPSPAKTLDVGGDANITGKITSSSIGINNPTPTKALDVVGDTNIVGKVGINNAAPTKALDIVGDVKITGNIIGATFGFGGLYTVAPEKPSASRVNPITNSYSCPSGFTSYQAMVTRDPDTYYQVLYVCVK